MIRRIRDFVGRRRAFLAHWGMEFVVVVAGVLLALAVQGWAEGRAAHAQAAAAEQQIRAELAANVPFMVERIALAVCTTDRLDYLAGRLADGPADPSPLKGYTDGETPPRIYLAPIRPIYSDAYRSALGAAALASLAPGRLAALTAIYAGLSFYDQAQAEEGVLRSRLSALDVGVPADVRDRRGLHADVDRLQRVNRLLIGIAGQTLDLIARAGLTPDAQAVRRDWSLIVPMLRDTYGPCFDPAAADRLLRGDFRRPTPAR